MRRSAVWLLWTAVALLPSALPAETAVLLADLRTGDDPFATSLDPRALTPVGAQLFFLDGHRGLWVTDGTALGTRALLSLCQPLCEAAGEGILGHDGRLLYAAAGESPTALRLWRTDGTRPGTFLLGSPDLVLPAEPGARPLTAAAGRRFFFEGCTADSGCGLWGTDGSEAGTRSLLDGSLSALAASSSQAFAATAAGEVWVSDGTATGTAVLAGGLSSVDALTAADGRAFFFARDGRGTELWTSDGTPAGTRPLTDLALADPFGSDAWIKAVGGRVYFVADDGANGQELWRSDGTPAGTRRVTAAGFVRAFEQLLPARLGEVQGRLVFPLQEAEGGLPSRLWTVPAAASTTAPALLCTGAGCPFLLGQELVPAGGRLVFAGADATHGFEPWSTDGTAQGTVSLGDFCPAVCQGLQPPIAAAGGNAYFVVLRGRGIRPELWSTGGTPALTRRVAGQVDGLPLRYQLPLEVAAVGQRLFFVSALVSGDVELWTVDAPQGEPRRVADLGRGGRSSFPHGFAASGGRLLFAACDAADATRRWVTGGAAPVPLFTVSPSCPAAAPPPVFAGGRAFWSHVTAGTAELWSSDLTAGGTVRLAAFPTTAPLQFAAFPSRVLFTVVLPEAGGQRSELWVSDGTAGGTRRLSGLSGVPRGLAVLGNEAFVGVETAAGGGQIWRTDGTQGGTLVEAVGTFRFADLPFLRVGPLSAYFFAADAGGPMALWDLNRSSNAPFRISPPLPDPAGAIVHQGAIYFWAGDAGTGRQIWRSDGTAPGTWRVHAFEPRPDTPLPETLTSFGSLLLFAAADGEHGGELWVSDGSREGSPGVLGTRLLADIAPGAPSSWPADLAVAGGRVFFSAFDPVHGRELWQTDGTAAGTRLVQDLNPGTADARPAEMTPLGDRLYFAATDGETGLEPWYLPLQSGGPPCRPGPERLCLAGGRFQVEVDWRDFGGRTSAGRAVPLTADTGAFWFFDAANLELVVKVLDGNGLNDHFWVFYGALSSVEYTLTVTDTRTGAARRYVNQAGQLASVGDTQAFGPLGASARTPLSVAPASAAALAGLPLVAERTDPAAAVPCQPGPRRLCLNGGRFAVSATWKDFQGHTGEGTALPLTGDTGAFWFFAPDNLEVLIKVLDGRALNGKFWVFYGALSNVEYELTVTDSETGTVKTYRNVRGRFASVADTGAF